MLVTFKGLLPYPDRPIVPTSLPSVASFLLDAVNEKIALIFRAGVSKSVRYVHFRTGTVVTGSTVDLRVETVTSLGEPSGVLWATNTNGSCVIGAGDDNVWKVGQLTADAVLVKGDLVSLTINNPSGGSVSVAGYSDDAVSGNFPYGTHFTGTWTKSTANIPLIVMEYADGTFDSLFGLTSVPNNFGVTAMNTGTVPDEKGIKFRVPFPCRATGCWIWVSAAWDFDVRLYDSDGVTVLANGGAGSSLSVINAVNLRSAAAAAVQTLPFKGEAVLLPNRDYRLTVLPTTATSMTLYDFDVADIRMLDMVCGGRDVHYTERTNAGAWTDVTNKRAYLGLMIDQLESGFSPRAAFQVGL